MGWQKLRKISTGDTQDSSPKKQTFSKKWGRKRTFQACLTLLFLGNWFLAFSRLLLFPLSILDSQLFCHLCLVSFCSPMLQIKHSWQVICFMLTSVGSMGFCMDTVLLSHQIMSPLLALPWAWYFCVSYLIIFSSILRCFGLCITCLFNNKFYELSLTSRIAR